MTSLALLTTPELLDTYEDVVGTRLWTRVQVGAGAFSHDDDASARLALTQRDAVRVRAEVERRLALHP